MHTREKYSNPLWNGRKRLHNVQNSRLAPSEQVVAVALRNTLPELLATAAKTAIHAKFIRDRLDLSRTEGISLAARAARPHIAGLSSNI